MDDGWKLLEAWQRGDESAGGKLLVRALRGLSLEQQIVLELGMIEGFNGSEIAHKLAVSKRTLQRRLRDEQMTFQAVLNRTREDLARYYLAQTKLSGAQIPYLLGFGDPNSFFRAFHAWTGQTTEQVRVSSAH